MFPRPSSANDATKRQSRHTGSLSIVFASVYIWRFSYNRFVSKIAIAFPHSYERTVVGHFVYCAVDFTHAVNLYAHV